MGFLIIVDRLVFKKIVDYKATLHTLCKLYNTLLYSWVSCDVIYLNGGQL